MPSRTRVRTPVAAPAVQTVSKTKPVKAASVHVPEASEFNAAMKEIHNAKHLGEASLFSATTLPRFRMTPSGVFLLDYALMGGFAEGVMHMIYGHRGSGKTTLAAKLIAQSQMKYPAGRAVIMDREGTMDRDWFEKMGVDLNRLAYSRPNTGEDTVDVMNRVLKAKETSIVVLDSVPATVPSAVADASAHDDTMGKLAGLMGKMCSMITTTLAQEAARGHRPLILLINQYRDNLAFGMNPNKLPGGRQIGYMSFAPMEIKKKEITVSGKKRLDKEAGVASGGSKDDESTSEILYNEHTFVIERCKSGNVIRTGKYNIIIDPDNPLGQGAVDDAPVVVNYAKMQGVVHGGGQSWRIEGINGTEDEQEESRVAPFRNLDGVIEFVRDNPNVDLELRQKLIIIERVKRGLPELPPDSYLLAPENA